MRKIQNKIKTDLKFVYSENNTVSVIFQSNDLLLGVLGEFNENLKELEKLTDTNLYFRGNSIIIKSEPKKNEIVKNAIQFLCNQFINNGSIEKKDIVSSINKFMIDENNNSSRNIEYIIKTPKKSVIPRSEKQKNYVRALKENEIIISAGPAGTGKTYQAVAMSVSALKSRSVDRIIITRPAVEAGEHLGFLPGDLKEKIDPYLTPLYDALRFMLPKDKLRLLLESRVIEIAPLAYMRGRTLHNSFIILDEAQNATPMQMKMFLTRLGVTSRAIITGDITQIDLPDIDKSGLIDAANILKNISGIGFVIFNESDVVRHHLVKKIIKAYAYNENHNQQSD